MTELEIGDYVAHFHGMPVDYDFAVVIARRGNSYLCYDPWRNWEFTSTLARPNIDLHGLVKLKPHQMERTRTSSERDGQRISQTVVEAVKYARATGLFAQRERAAWRGAERAS